MSTPTRPRLVAEDSAGNEHPLPATAILDKVPGNYHGHVIVRGFGVTWIETSEGRPSRFSAEDSGSSSGARSPASTQGARGWLVRGWYGLGRDRFLAPFFMGVTNPLFWEAMDLMAISFEFGFLVSLVRGWIFRAFVFIAVIFHFVNMLTINIGFMIMLPVYVLFAYWERLVHGLPHGLMRLADRVASYRALAGLAILFLPLYLVADRVSVNIAAGAFSHLGVLAELTRVFDYGWVLDATVLPVAVALALGFAGLPHGRRRVATSCRAAAPTSFSSMVCATSATPTSISCCGAIGSGA